MAPPVPWDSEKAQRLKDFLKHHTPSLSARAIAIAAGIDPSHLSRVLRADASPSTATLQAVAQAVKMPAQELFSFVFQEESGKILEMAAASGPAGAALKDEKRRIEDKDLLKLVNFTVDDSPAIRCLSHFILSGLNDSSLDKFLENVVVFFALAGKVDRVTAPVLHRSLKDMRRQDIPGYLLSSIENSRLAFHALVFSLYPIQYALDGGIQLDKAFRFQEPDKYLSLPRQILPSLLERFLPGKDKDQDV